MSENVWSDRIGEQLRNALIAHAPSSAHAEAHLRAAISEAVHRPGKLFRGRLVYATLTAHDGDGSNALILATAVEYFHLSSLLLDDLPCMDDAVTRRGHECAHRVHGEATAILAALAFINRAYLLAGRAFVDRPAAVRMRAQDCLDAVLGSAGLIGGQSRDLRFGAGDRSPREVQRIAIWKTGSLLRLGLAYPALLVSQNREERRDMNALCVYWGLAFQALDDLQDVLGNSIDAAKTTGQDRVLFRPNLALAIGVGATRRRIIGLLDQASRRVQQLVKQRGTWDYLRQFQQYLALMTAPLVGKGEQTAA